jgi:hypothetical protein
MDIQRCCLFGGVSAKISKFKLKQVYATTNTSRVSVDVQNLKPFVDRTVLTSQTLAFLEIFQFVKLIKSLLSKAKSETLMFFSKRLGVTLFGQYDIQCIFFNCCHRELHGKTYTPC